MGDCKHEIGSSAVRRAHSLKAELHKLFQMDYLDQSFLITSDNIPRPHQQSSLIVTDVSGRQTDMASVASDKLS
ncbi:hypothetical protein CEXT_138221 [Caerostris extrusa]|uniref:Uncharacterized protein n=1 Tax=Caerostris extrusa TaxID=172846 RepID=A0AAV4QTR8_CAEEX|nr:hypothetical protein CEXT_138221 [Caerostris extrusa]